MYDIIAGLVLLVIMWLFMESFIGKVHLNKILRPLWQAVLWVLLSVLKTIIWIIETICLKVFKIELRKKDLPGRKD
jgi:hypothetical protein